MRFDDLAGEKVIPLENLDHNDVDFINVRGLPQVFGEGGYRAICVTLRGCEQAPSDAVIAFPIARWLAVCAGAQSELGREFFHGNSVGRKNRAA
jgi:hypothetical protein